MSEALQDILDYGFKTLKLDKIEAYTHRENENSKQMLLKNGFSLMESKLDEGFPHNIVLEIKRPLDQR